MDTKKVTGEMIWFLFSGPRKNGLRKNGPPGKMVPPEKWSPVKKPEKNGHEKSPGEMIFFTGDLFSKGPFFRGFFFQGTTFPGFIYMAHVNKYSVFIKKNIRRI